MGAHLHKLKQATSNHPQLVVIPGSHRIRQVIARAPPADQQSDDDAKWEKTSLSRLLIGGASLMATIMGLVVVPYQVHCYQNSDYLKTYQGLYATYLTMTC